MSAERFEVAVVGAGLVGLATARALQDRGVTSLVVLEAESEVAAHQSGHNSGVIHSGLYYKPGSEKAKLCVEGRTLLEAFCAEQGVTWERCGKLVVATDASEVSRLDELERRGRENGLQGIRRLALEEITEREPHVAGVAALLVPETGIADYPGMARALASSIEERGGSIRFERALRGARREGAGFVLETAVGELRATKLVACAGLQADRVARACGLEPNLRIVPFRGEYWDLAKAREHLVRGLVYPVPDPRFPFLGVHFTRKALGGVEAGPNAVLAWRREGYRKGSFSLRDSASTFGWPGFWRMLPATLRPALGEVWRSWSKNAFVRALQKLLPEIRAEDLVPGGAGVRAQALGRDGKLLDDFAFAEAEGQVHVLNAPSPAATACLAIGERIADRLHGAIEARRDSE